MCKNTCDFENETFDFERFFFGNEYDAALMVITPIQEISLYTDFHDDAAKKIYETLYDRKMNDEYFGTLFNNMGQLLFKL